MGAIKSKVLVNVKKAAPPRIVEREKVKHRVQRRTWRQTLRFLMSCLKSRRSDLSLESWRRLEYRNERQPVESVQIRNGHRLL